METDILYNEDCMLGLKRIPNESIDLVCTDPPYKIRQHTTSISRGMFLKKEVRDGKVFNDNDLDIGDWLPEIYRVLKQGTHCYVMVNNFNLIHYLKVIDDSGFHFTRLLVWDKHMKINGIMYMNQVEFVLMLSKGRQRKINNCGTSDLLHFPLKKLKDKQGNNLHDTEKPVSLMETLVTNSTDMGGVVLDPFAGIGSTLLAAQRNNRRYIGFEINEKYWRIAERRLEEQRSQPTLF